MTMKSFSLPTSDVEFLTLQMRTDIQAYEAQMVELSRRNAPASQLRDLNATVTRLKRLINTLS